MRPWDESKVRRSKLGGHEGEFARLLSAGIELKLGDALADLQQRGAVVTIHNPHRPDVDGAKGYVHGWHVVGGKDSFSVWTPDGRTTAWASELRFEGRVLSEQERIATLRRSRGIDEKPKSLGSEREVGWDEPQALGSELQEDEIAMPAEEIRVGDRIANRFGEDTEVWAVGTDIHGDPMIEHGSPRMAPEKRRHGKRIMVKRGKTIRVRPRDEPQALGSEEPEALRAELARIKNTDTPEARARAREIRGILKERQDEEGGSALRRSLGSEAEEIDPKVGEHWLVYLYPRSPKKEVVIEKAGPKVIRYREVSPVVPSQAGGSHYREQGFEGMGWERVEAGQEQEAAPRPEKKTKTTTYTVTTGSGETVTRRTEGTYVAAAENEHGRVTFHGRRDLAQRAAGPYGTVHDLSDQNPEAQPHVQENFMTVTMGDETYRVREVKSGVWEVEGYGEFEAAAPIMAVKEAQRRKREIGWH